MSLLNIDELQPLELLSEVVVGMRGRGHFLTRNEVDLLAKWLMLAQGRTDDIVLALEEIYGPKLEKTLASGKKQLSLQSVNRTVVKRLIERSLI